MNLKGKNFLKLLDFTPEEIGGYDFCPADEEILARLRLEGKTAAE